MIYFLIEISGLNQLRNVEAEQMQTAINSLYKILCIKEYNVLVRNNDFILLSLLYKEIHKDRIIDSFFESFDFLKKREKLLQSFNIVVDYREDTTEEEEYNRLLTSLFKTETINSLFITGEAGKMFSDYFEYIGEGELLRIINRKDYIDPLFSRGGSLHHREEVRQLIIDSIVGFSGQEEKLVHIHSSVNSCVRENLKRALDEIGGQEDINWCWFRAETDENKYRPPFIDDFLELDYLKYSDFSGETEKKILDTADSEFSPNQDRLFEDMYLKISLYLKSYIQFCRKKIIPPVIVFENTDRIDEKGNVWLADLLASISGAIPVLLSNSDSLPDQFSEWEIMDIAVDDMNEEEIDTKLPDIEEKSAEKTKIIKLCEHNPDYLFYYSYLKAKGISLNAIKKKEDILNLLVKNFDYPVQKIFYILAVCHSFLGINRITEFCRKAGIENEQIDSALDELSSLNFIEIDTTGMQIRKQEALKPVAGCLKEDRKDIDRELVHYLDSIKDTRLLFRNGVISFLLKRLYYDSALDLMLEALMYCIDRNEIDFAQSALKKCMKYHDRKAQDNVKLENLVTYVKLRIALVSGDEISAANLFPLLPGYSDTEARLENLVLQGKYHNAVKNYRSAMTCLKSILVRVEEHEDPVAVGKAYLELGLSFLGLRKLEEAKEYFFIAQEHAGRFKLTYQYIRSLIMHAAVLQFIGNYSESVRLLEEAAGLCDSSSCRVWQTLAMFLLGRTRFELGEYDQAMSVLQQTMTLSKLYHIPEVIPVSYRWMARCFSLQGSYSVAETILEDMDHSLERDYILAEDYYFQDRTVDAKNKLEENTRNLKAESFRPSEYIVYTTGFSMVEDFSLSSADGECVLSYLDRAFTSYINGMSGAANEASADLFSITREDKLADIDPNIHLYFLFATLVAKDIEETPALDKITLLSKGLKILQERASEIDAPQERRDFLNKNKWNSILLDEAKKYKLT